MVSSPMVRFEWWLDDHPAVETLLTFAVVIGATLGSLFLLAWVMG